MPTDSGALRAKIRDAIWNQPYSTVTALSSLLAVQDALHYLPEQAMEEVAEYTDTTINDVWGVASFYLNFRFSPPGQHAVEVCWGPPCHLRGAMELLQEVLNHLGLENEGDTADGLVSLKFNTCLGACPHAPVISVNHRLMGGMTPQRAREILDDLRNGQHGASQGGV